MDVQYSNIKCQTDTPYLEQLDTCLYQYSFFLIYIVNRCVAVRGEDRLAAFPLDLCSKIGWMIFSVILLGSIENCSLLLDSLMYSEISI